MGIDPFLLSSSLIGVLAQRLVRVLSPDSKQPFQAGEYERRLLNLRADEPLPTLYRPGRDATGGYRDRKSGGEGKRGDLGGRRIIKKKKKKHTVHAQPRYEDALHRTQY